MHLPVGDNAVITINLIIVVLLHQQEVQWGNEWCYSLNNNHYSLGQLTNVSLCCYSCTIVQTIKRELEVMLLDNVM